MRSSSPDNRSLLGRARNLSSGEWLDLAVAALELGRARLRLARIDAAALLEGAAAGATAGRSPAGQDSRVARVSKAIARASHRLPWRTDCLVQALAAQSWLRRYSLESQIVIGAKERVQDPFEAHAWLTCGDVVVTGGDVGGYAPLEAPRG